MGAQNSKSREKRVVIGRLKSLTHFTDRELQSWYNGFMKEYPDGKFGREDFKEICEEFFPFGDSRAFANFFFPLFDRNNDDWIDVEDFITSLSTISRGTLDEKIHWTFRLYDQGNHGYVTKEDMIHTVDAIYRMVDAVVHFPSDEDTPEKRVAKIFSVMNKTEEESVLTVEEFVAGCKADGKILRALSGYDDLV